VDVAWTWRNDIRTTAWLYGLVRDRRPRLVVETGVHLGKSSVALLSALRKNGSGRLISIDLPMAGPGINRDGVEDHAHVVTVEETGSLVPRRLRDGWDLRMGDARRLVPLLPSRVDMFYHDSDHSYDHQAFEYAEAWRRLPIGGVLASDDTDWSMAWSDFTGAHRGEFRALPGGPVYQRAVLRTGGVEA